LAQKNEQGVANMKKLFIAPAVALACIATDGQARSAQGPSETSGYTVTISGYMPVLCHAETNIAAIPTQSGEVSLGALKEYCNNPNGYEVYADYSPVLAKASLSVDGRKIVLDASGTTRIDKSNRAAVVTRNLSLVLPEGVQPGTIAFRIVALQR
jgi:hypothetical protein